MHAEEMTESAIRALHQPPGAYRISVYKHPPGAMFNGAMREAVLYVRISAMAITWFA